MTSPLSVDPAALDGAGSAVVEVGDALGQAVNTLTTALSGLSGMAGDDPSGAALGRRYDAAAKAMLDAMVTTRNGMSRIGDGVRMSAHNYSVAESLSDVARRTDPLPKPPMSSPISASGLPSAVGGASNAPLGWGWVSPYIGMIWPSGDSTQLRAAAAAWMAASSQFLAVETTAAAPLGVVGAQQIPEGAAIGTAFSTALNSGTRIMVASSQIASQLTAYAANIDAVHAAILNLLAKICDPLTGIKMIWDVVTRDDENEIKQIAEDIRTVVDSFTEDVNVLRDQLATTVSGMAEVASAMGAYANKEWNQFLHGTAIGQVIDTQLRVDKGIIGQATGVLADNWRYGPLRAMLDPEGWFDNWGNAITGMAPLVGLGGEDAPGVLESWKNMGKEAVHWDLWQEDPAEALGRSLFDAGTAIIPGGGAAKGTAAVRGATEAAEGIGRGTGTAAERLPVAPRALEHAPAVTGKGDVPPAPHPHAEPPPERPTPPWAQPGHEPPPPDAKPVPAPTDRPLPQSPTEATTPVAETPGPHTPAGATTHQPGLADPTHAPAAAAADGSSARGSGPLSQPDIADNTHTPTAHEPAKASGNQQSELAHAGTPSAEKSAIPTAAEPNRHPTPATASASEGHIPGLAASDAPDAHAQSQPHAAPTEPARPPPPPASDASQSSSSPSAPETPSSRGSGERPSSTLGPPAAPKDDGFPTGHSPDAGSSGQPESPASQATGRADDGHNVAHQSGEHIGDHSDTPAGSHQVANVESIHEEMHNMRPWDRDRIGLAITPGELEKSLIAGDAPPEVAASAANSPHLN